MPTSDAQRSANRQNAAHSTGPRTPRGKQRSSLNATRHGLTGQVNVTTPDDQKAYDALCREFTEDWRPVGGTERHLVQTLADTQWQMHHASSLLRSIHAIGFSDLENRIDVDHAQVHAALTAGLVAMDKGKELDLISRYAARLNRSYRQTLHDLQTLQATRKQHEERDMTEAALLRNYYKMEGAPFVPSEFGFVLRVGQIDAYNRRREALDKARNACEFRFNREKYHAAHR